MATEKFSLRSVLKSAEVTQTGEIKPLRTWDTMASSIHKSRNDVVATQAEEARLLTALEDVRERMAEVMRIHEEQKALWIKASSDVLGVVIKDEE